MSHMQDFHPAEGGCHLVGSVPFPDTDSVMRNCAVHLDSHLRRMPDGETGERSYYIGFQIEKFAGAPEVLQPWDKVLINEELEQQVQEDEMQSVLSRLPSRIETTYDSYAINSYKDFKRLRDDEKIIPAAMRFQVSLPSPTNVPLLQVQKYRAGLAPLYEASLLQSFKVIQASIPHKDLAIQIDMAADFAVLEGILQPWWDTRNGESTLQGIVNRVLRAAEAVEDDVELGFHFCYGDHMHKHFKEPKDTGVLVQVATALLRKLKRPVSWMHMPVPKDREDKEYFAPLADFEVVKQETGGHTTLYLGLVHPNDLDGTKRRMQAARSVLKHGFGVSTECGLGRVPVEDIESIFQIFRGVSKSVLPTTS